MRGQLGIGAGTRGACSAGKGARRPAAARPHGPATAGAAGAAAPLRERAPEHPAGRGGEARPAAPKGAGAVSSSPEGEERAGRVQMGGGS